MKSTYLIIASVMLFAMSASAQTKKKVTRKTTTTAVKKVVKPVVVEDPTLVDLGLPSGTKWADRNMGASSPTSSCNYYAFGAISEKQENSNDTNTCNDDITDIAGTEYDAATKKYGAGWSIPTREQWQELMDNCTVEVKMVDKKLGIKFTGKNNNSIFVTSTSPVIKGRTAEQQKTIDLAMKQQAGKVNYYNEQAKVYGLTFKNFCSFYRTSARMITFACEGVVSISRDGNVKERSKELQFVGNNNNIMLYGSMPIRPVFNNKQSSETSQTTIPSSATSSSSTASNQKTYDEVEEMPQFPGGDSALMSYLANNVKYPVVAQENGVQGRVNVGFVVETDGSITNVKVKRSVDPSLDREALRVIKAMPKWKPGKLNGSPVRVNYTTPVVFRLN